MRVTGLFPLLLAFYEYSILLVGTVAGAGVDGVATPPLISDEALALVAVKSSLSDPTGALASWSLSDPTPCAWAHVACDPPASRVRRLSLSSLSLAGGPLPAVLSLLPFLRRLSLANNSLSGRLPADAGRLPNLVSIDLSLNRLSGGLPEALFSPAGTGASLRRLDLAGNQLSGPIPASLRHCPLLLHLNLSGNRLSGSPDFSAAGLWSLTRLRVLDLSDNFLSGPVPDGIANLHNLKVLNLGGNRFEGSIPAGVGLCPHLTTLDLSRNAFDGAVPDTLRYLRSLTFVSLSENRLSGEVPTWLGEYWTGVQHLDLSQNSFTGSLPASLGELKGLNYLSLAGNMLTGEISPALFGLGLQVLDLSSNDLTGKMPPGSALAAETLRYLDLSKNKLTGNVPAEWALYFGLRYVNLSWNELQTQLPPELGYFKNLSVLDLRSNALYGPIPGDLCDSGGLSVLQLDGNSLSGAIPEEIGNCTSLHLLSLSHNSLSGPIPAAVSRLKKLQILNLEFNGLSGEIPQQLGELDDLLVVNISHNRLIGRLPAGGVFQSLDRSALEGNLGLCSPLVAEPCKMDVPKPLVLDPNAYNAGNSAAGNPAVTVTNPGTMPNRRRKFLSVSSMVAISAAIVIVLGVLVITILNVSARRRLGLLETALESMCSGSSRSGSPAIGKVVLFGPRSNPRSADLVGTEAETLLGRATEIGRGVFGTVYKATLKEGRLVAIKKLLTANIIPYHDDFDREVRILGKARHPNLMPLKGYYWTPQLQLLISDYAAGGSLHARLHERPESKPPLPWADRFKIALGTAEGLAYLHQSFRPPMIHYGIKPGNILLDEDCNPRISDFGLARLLPKLDKHVSSSRFQSAAGYIAPELACQSLRINEKCDVYSFGVVIVELVTGKKPVEYGEDDVVIAIDQVRAQLERGSVLDCVDPSMGEFPEEEVLPVLKLGLVCTSQIPSSRPSMAEVVQILQVIKTPVLHRVEP